jgi:hypothetical protein
MARSSCPSAAELVREAMRPAATNPNRAHLANCPVCAASLRELRAVAMGLIPATGERLGEPCLDEMAMARAAEGSASPAELSHLSLCSICRGQVAGAVSAMRDPAIAGETRRLDAASRPPMVRWLAVGSLAAAAVFAVMVSQRPTSDRAAEPTRYRDAPITEQAFPAIIGPVGVAVTQPVALRWSTVPGATQYHTTVFDEEGTIVWDGETTDTVATIPVAAGLADGTAYWWRVEARIEFDRWSQSEIAPFRVVPTPPPR